MWLKSTGLLRMPWSQSAKGSLPNLWLITPVHGHMLLHLIAVKCTVFCFLIHEIIMKLNILQKQCFWRKFKASPKLGTVLNLHQNSPRACQMRQLKSQKVLIPRGGTNPLSTNSLLLAFSNNGHTDSTLC